MILLGVLACFSLIFIIAAFFFADQTAIIGSALVGSILAPINIGVIFDPDMDSFEESKSK